MKRGEQVTLAVIAVVVVLSATYSYYVNNSDRNGADRGIPFYSTADDALAKRASTLLQQNDCKDCHTLWTVRDMLQAVPAPALDGIGAIRDEEWFFNYFSAADPQAILPSRLKPQYRMPSFAKLPEADRRTLAQYMASLKVKDWYLQETRKAEYEKLTGKDYQP
jgi:hypothetical protein